MEGEMGELDISALIGTSYNPHNSGNCKQKEGSMLTKEPTHHRGTTHQQI
jgi:hypothetical protein